MTLPVIKMKLNGVVMPAPLIGGVSMKRNPIWSKNAGRNGKSTMIGTIKASKWEYAVKWPPLTEDQFQLIDSNCSDVGHQWVDVEFTMDDSSIISFEAYTGAPESVGWTPAGGVWHRTGIQVTMIQR